jgi:hypothetical protein
MCPGSVDLWFFPTTTRCFTIGSSDFSGYKRTFTRDTALSKDGSDDKCKFARHGTVIYLYNLYCTFEFDITDFKYA